MLKNGQMQGARVSFPLPVRQAILRVASRRVRSDFCHADELVSRLEAYLAVRRNDGGRRERGRWPFFSNLLNLFVALGQILKSDVQAQDAFDLSDIIPDRPGKRDAECAGVF